MKFYVFCRGLCRFFLKLFYFTDYQDEENIPLKGSFIFCSNHVSNLDPVILGTTKKRIFYYLAKEELFHLPLLGWILKKLPLIPVKRGSGDLGAVKKAIEVLQQGKALVMFPEGTRSKDGTLKEGKNGVALIAKKADCHIVPCAVSRKHRLFRKSVVRYGMPFSPEEYLKQRDLTGLTKKIMQEIQNLLEEL